MLLEKLFENLALSIEAFATCGVSRGWRLTVPGLEWVTLHFVMQGEGTLTLPSGATYPLPNYSLAVVPAGLEHDLVCGSDVANAARVGEGEPSDTEIPHFLAGPKGRTELVVACGRFQAVYGSGLELFGHLKEVVVVEFSETEKMRSTFEMVLEEQKAGSAGSAAMMSALLSQCLVLMFRKLAERPGHSLAWLDALEDPRMERVIGAVLEKPEQPYTLEGLADLAGMSRSVFAKRFHDGFGRTAMDYVREVRLRSSARLLSQPDLSIDTIASRVGFASRSHFSKAFTEQFGCSPTAFRSQDKSGA